MKDFNFPPGVLVRQQMFTAIGGDMIKIKGKNGFGRLKKQIQINNQADVGDFLHSTQKETSLKSGIRKEDEVLDFSQIQPASLDLTLGDTVYHVPFTFLDYRRHIKEILDNYSEMQYDISNGKKALLHKDQTYVVPLTEELDLNHDIHARCNPKSSSGRIDVFVRTIIDKGIEFDNIPPGYKGKLYLVIIPQSFDIMITSGLSLNQIRFIKEKPGFIVKEDRMLEQLNRKLGIIYDYKEEFASGFNIFDKKDGSIKLGVRLKGINGSKVIGFKTKAGSKEVMDLTKTEFYDPEDFFEPILEEHIQDKPLILNHGEFYLLASDLKVGVPPRSCAELTSYHEGYGEHRSHYAGFFDPGFGWAVNEKGERTLKGCYVVYEVRINGPSVALFRDKNGNSQSRFVKLHFYKNSQVPEVLYGADIGSSYQGQGLRLAKYFKRNWEEEYK